MRKDRMESLSDRVLTIVVTIVVLELRPPNYAMYPSSIVMGVSFQESFSPSRRCADPRCEPTESCAKAASPSAPGARRADARSWSQQCTACASARARPHVVVSVGMPVQIRGEETGWQDQTLPLPLFSILWPINSHGEADVKRRIMFPKPRALPAVDGDPSIVPG